MRKKWKSRLLLLGASTMLFCTKMPSYVSAEELFGDGDVFFSESEKVAEETSEETAFDNFSDGEFTDVFETPEKEDLFMEETGIEEEQLQAGIEDVSNYGNWIGFVNTDGTFTVTGCRNLSEFVNGTLEIPNMIQGMEVTRIEGQPVNFEIFSPRNITKLILPDTVTSIDSFTFEKFVDLDTIVFPNDPYLDLGINTFSKECKIRHITTAGNYGRNSGVNADTITDITFHEGVDHVNSGDFKELTTINLPSTVKKFEWSDSPKLTMINCPKPLDEISVPELRNCPNLHIAVHIRQLDESGNDLWFGSSYGAFSGSGVTSVTIDGSLLRRGLDKNSFTGCPSLQAIYVTESADTGGFYSKDGVLYWSNPKYPEEPLYWNDDLFAYPAGKSTATEYVIPYNIKCIYAAAFDSCKFTKIVCPEKMNPEFYWDYMTDSVYNPTTGNYEGKTLSLFSYCDASLKLIKGSKAWKWKDITAAASDLAVSSGRIQLYKGNTYSISYNLAGGKNASGNPVSYQAGDDTITLKKPTRSGYKFLGWKRNDVANGYCDHTEITDYFKNYVFTAEWKKDVPAAPAFSSVSNVTKGIALKWTKVTGADGYYVYRKSGTEKYKKIKTIKGAGTVSYTDTSVKAKNGKTYTYSIKAYKGKSTSAYCKTPKKLVRMATPTISKPVNKATGKLLVKWNKNSAASGYQIQYATSSKFQKATTVTIKSGKTLSSTITKGIARNKKYYIRVRSYKKVGKTTYYSGWSKTESIKITK